MPQFPPVPAWDGLHPLIIHFPIGLLLVAPLFLILGAIGGPKWGRNFLWAALLLMVLGTAAVFIAVETGEAAGKLAERSAEINPILEHHERLAERTRLTFAILTVVFAVLMVGTTLLPRLRSRLFLTVAPLVLLLFYGFGALLLSDTAHHGGRLVHEFGVKALVTGPERPVPPSSKPADD